MSDASIAMTATVLDIMFPLYGFIITVAGIWVTFEGKGWQNRDDQAQNRHPVSRRTLTVREIGALSDLDNVTVRIADVAANLAVLGYRLRDELGSSTFP